MVRSALSRLSLKVSAPLVLAVPVLLVVVALSVVAFVQGRSAASDLASQNLRQIHDRIAERVDTLLRVPGRINRVNESLIRQGKLDPADPRSWRETFFQQASAFEMLSSVTWGNAAQLQPFQDPIDGKSGHARNSRRLMY